MSSAATKKVFIQIETAAEQQENIKNQRKTLKVLQGVDKDKENRTNHTQIDKLKNLKAAAVDINIEYGKRKKMETKVAETQTSPGSKSVKEITAEDLCSEGKPGEHYWERLAEKRREALEQSLEENQCLRELKDGLEEELNTSRQQLKEAKHLVSVLTEMLNENDTEQEETDEENNEETDDEEEEAEEEKNEEQEETDEGVTAAEDDVSQSDDLNSSTSKANKKDQL